MPLPPGRLTRKQIRDLACIRAGNPAISDSQVPYYLQLVLDDLYQQHPWPFLYVQADIAAVGMTFALPADFLQSQDQSALQLVTFDGVKLESILQEVDAERFAETTVPDTSEGVPEIWHADRATGLASLFPDPTGHVLALTLRYRRLPASLVDATGPLPGEATDIPVFPYHHYLVQALFALVLYYEGDQRADAQVQIADEMLKRILGSAVPLRSTAPVVPLDEEVFVTPFRNDSLSSGNR